MITSDKAYDNVEWVWGYRETDKLGGVDPYSASKGMAELAIRSYVKSFFNGPDSNVRVGIARAGNVIGGGDWSEDRIIPDAIRALIDNKNFAELKAKDLMNTNPLVALDSDNLQVAEKRMREAKVQCLIVKNLMNEVVGVIQIFE